MAHHAFLVLRDVCMNWSARGDSLSHTMYWNTCPCQCCILLRVPTWPVGVNALLPTVALGCSTCLAAGGTVAPDVLIGAPSSVQCSLMCASAYLLHDATFSQDHKKWANNFSICKSSMLKLQSNSLRWPSWLQRYEAICPDSEVAE